MSEYLYTTPPLDRSVGLRRHVMTTAMHSFGGWGYREIQVPMLHYFDALRPGLDDSLIERSFRFVDRGGNVMMLRPDVTPAIAQTFAYMRNPGLPLRVSYTHKVVRLERSLRRNQLETYQLGAEHIGGDEFLGDVEILLLALEVLERLKVPDVQVRLADHQLANTLLMASGAPARLRDDIRQALVARDAHEVRDLLTRIGIRDNYVKAIMALVQLKGGIHQLDSIREIFPYDRKITERLDYLRRLIETLNELDVGRRVHIELAELGGASYYTGIGFAMVSGSATRELGRGGRYDELIGHYGKPTRACGFSFSLEMLIQALHPGLLEQTLDREIPEPVHVDPQAPSEGLKALMALRRADSPARIIERPSS